MTRIAALFALLAALALAAPAQAQNDCNRTALYDAATNGSTVLITGRSTANVRICGFNIWAAGTATVKLVTGTGVACATNETAITPAYSLVTQTGITDSSTYWRGLMAAAGLDVCIKTSAGVAVQAQIYYSQR